MIIDFLCGNLNVPMPVMLESVAGIVAFYQQILMVLMVLTSMVNQT
jgi:hypothetical protein